MSPESGEVVKKKLGGLTGCLVDGDPEQSARERKVRRRALVLSIGFETVVLATIVLVPLFGKPAEIVLPFVTPVPPYYSRPLQQNVRVVAPARAHPRPLDPHFFPPTSISNRVVTHEEPQEPEGANNQPSDGQIETFGEIPLVHSRGPLTPLPPPPITPRVVHVTHIDPAMLTNRVEPIYPVLMKQIGRSGHVELRAVIAEDGTIQSLEAVGGDAGFYASALEAVRQWRYTPTLLNGVGVKVDTHITVIYNLQR
jgi:protein TonB